MLLTVRDAKNFNFAACGHVNARESFYLLNSQPNNQLNSLSSLVKQNYYIHIDSQNILKPDGGNTVLEVNASLNATKLIAKIFESEIKNES